MPSEMFNPPHPGRILRRCFSTGTQADAASAEGITYSQLVALYEGRADITPELSAKLDRIFFKKSDGFFLRMQEHYDEWLIDQRSKEMPGQRVIPVPLDVSAKVLLWNQRVSG